MVMDRIKAETHRQIITNFYWENSAKDKLYTGGHFSPKMWGLVKRVVYQGGYVSKLKEAHKRRVQQKIQTVKANILIMANEEPLFIDYILS